MFDLIFETIKMYFLNVKLNVSSFCGLPGDTQWMLSSHKDHIHISHFDEQTEYETLRNSFACRHLHIDHIYTLITFTHWSHFHNFTLIRGNHAGGNLSEEISVYLSLYRLGTPRGSCNLVLREHGCGCATRRSRFEVFFLY